MRQTPLHVVLCMVAAFGLAACGADSQFRSSEDADDGGASTDGGGATGDDATGNATTGDGGGTGDATTGDDGGAGDATTGDGGGTGDATTGDDGGGFECPEATGERPPAISEHAHVFDPIKERIVYFGGNPEFPVNCQGKNAYLADTWAYWPRCNVWEKLDATGPAARGRAAAVYDPDGHAMFVFGGRFREKGVSGMTPYTLHDETWRLDLTSDVWTQVQTSGGPSPRVNASWIWDPDGRAMLFGGNQSTSGISYAPLDDLWAFEPGAEAGEGTWTALSASGQKPSPRLFAAAVYDPVGHAMVITQGGDQDAFLGPFLGDTWALDLSDLSWSLIDVGGAGKPDKRIWGRAVYSSQIDRLVLFGGHDDGALGNRNDVWMFDLRELEWEQAMAGDVLNNTEVGFCDFPADFATIAEGTPERRGSHVAVYWEAERSLLLHGGKTDCGLIDDVWQLDVFTLEWTQHEPASIGEACLRTSSNCTSHCF